jgi:hypothetical protein
LLKPTLSDWIPVRARSAAWMSAIASLPPSRSARSSSSSRSCPGRHGRLVAETSGGRPTSARGDCVRQLGAVVPRAQRLARARPRRRRRAAQQPLERRVHRRQPPERVAEGAQLARGRPRGGGLGGEALDVAHAVERLAQRLARQRVGGERGHGVEARVDGVLLDQRGEQPLAQQARAHRRLRAIEHGQQRARAVAVGARAQRLDQLEVAARHLVERHRAAGALHRRPREVRQAAGLQLAQVAQQRTGGADGRLVGGTEAEALERVHGELARQVVARQRRIELPGPRAR